MPRNRKSGQTQFNESNPDNVFFSDVKIGREVRESFLAWFDANLPDIQTWTSEATREGYRFTLKYDFNNMCFSCSTTQQDAKHKNYKTILISRSDDPILALGMNIYKIYEMYPDDPLPRNDGFDTWG